ncbi:MAG: hypothetical protein Fur0022_16780 [Anaerolineales bacterium]
MSTLEEEMEQYASDLSKLNKEDFWKGIGILLTIGGEVTAWIAVIVATIKGLTLLSTIFPPALAGHIFTPALFYQAVGAVNRKYFEMSSYERKVVAAALGGLQVLVDPTQPHKIVEVLRTILR